MTSGLSIAAWKKGQQGAGVKGVGIDQKTTTPPKPYTEGTLLAAMKGAAAFIQDPKLREALKDAQGIGTPATRSSIVERLKEVGFLREEGGKKGAATYLRSTPQGRQVIGFLPTMLTDPGTTALWEQMLDMISRGNMPIEAFMERQVAAVSKLVADAFQAGSGKMVVDDGSSVPCAKVGCTGGGCLRKKKGQHGVYWGCSNHPQCTNKFTDTKLGPTLREAPAVVAPIDGDGSPCPGCGKGVLVTRTVTAKASKAFGKKFLSCSCYPSCKHSIWPDQK